LKNEKFLDTLLLI